MTKDAINHCLLYLFIAVALASCNKDEVIIGPDAAKPVITLDNEYGVYTVKVGHKLTIAPKYEHVVSADDVTWNVEGQELSHGYVFNAIWDKPGEYYATVTAENNAGSASEELRIDVLHLTPPVISLKIPVDGYYIEAGKDFLIKPYIDSDKECGTLAVMWMLDGVKAAEGLSFNFCPPAAGTYHITIIATNNDGESNLDFIVTATDGPPYSVNFTPQSYSQTSTERYTFAGRKVFLTPDIQHFTAPVFSWSINGSAAGSNESTYIFQPKAPGEHEIAVTVSEGSGDCAPSRTATVKVVCVNATESSRFRPKTGASSPRENRVYEYTPAPGQFIGDNNNEIRTAEQACIWAERTFKSASAVSLGSFGGYITVGFDHSIAKSHSYELAIGGNAFINTDGTGSNEPGIVYVMQDVNGNGLPDDEWYELKGCEYDNAGASRRFAVTYFRPGGPGQPIDWSDSNGNSGTIDYLPEFHDQPSYYPAWIKSSSYTLRGGRIPSNNIFDQSIGKWINRPYAWGYADNIGSDNLGPVAELLQATGFSLKNAVYPDGSPVVLEYIDFVKVQVAVLAKSGTLGEVSSEVCGFIDYTMMQ